MAEAKLEEDEEDDLDEFELEIQNVTSFLKSPKQTETTKDSYEELSATSPSRRDRAARASW